MKIDELHNEWEKDSVIDPTNLESELLNIPKIHAKYLRFLTNSKLILRKAESDLIRIRALKAKYFRGEMGAAELQELGWSQYQGNKPLKSEIDDVINKESDVLQKIEKVDYYKIVVQSIEYVMKEISSRHWEIRSAIEHKKIVNGLI